MGRARLYGVFGVVVVVIVVVIAVVASSGGDDPPQTTAAKAGLAPKPPESVVVRLESTSVLDWQKRATSAPLRMANPVYERLVIRSEKTREMVPYLAESWEQEPAAPAAPTKVTFKLKSGPTCSNGDPVTPEVVMASFQRLIDVEKEANENPNMFGPGPYKLSADNAAGTFTFETETPFRNLVAGFGKVGVICPEGLAAVKADPDALQKKQYGSGPYVLQSLKQDDEAVWTLRPEWKWGPEGKTAASLPKTLIYRVVQDQTTNANLLLSGELDVSDVTGPDVERLQNDKSLENKPNISYAVMPLQMNQRKGRVTADKAVREAIMTAVDPTAFNQAAFGGRAKVSASLLRPEVDCYDESVSGLAPKPDAERARQILQQAGYSAGSNGTMSKGGKALRLNLLTSTTHHGAGGEYIADALKKAGFDVKLDGVIAAQYGPRFVEGNWDAAISTGFSPTPDPGERWGLFVGAPPPEGGNYGATGLGNEEWERLYSEAMSSGGEKSCAAF
jgi:peptide/nickel transport system substrate-binding protein